MNEDLIESRYKLTTNEQKILLFIISKIIQSDKDIYKFYINEIEDLIGIEDFKNIITDLQKRIVFIKEKNKYYQFNWISSAVIDDNLIEIGIDPKFKYFLLNLNKDDFFNNIIQLKSIYSIRLYRILRNNRSESKVYYKLDDLKRKLGLDIQKYKKYGSFKKSILERAKNEINKNENTEIHFQIEGKTESRKVIGVTFYYSTTDLLNQLAFELLTLSFNYWEKHNKNNVDLANESRLWSCNNGRTRSLNEHLNRKTKNPDINRILETAKFILFHCDKNLCIKNDIIKLQERIDNFLYI